MWWSATMLGTAIGTTVAALLGLVPADDGPARAAFGEASGGLPLLVGVSPVTGDRDPEVRDRSVRLGDEAITFDGVVHDVEPTAGGLYVLVDDDLWVTDFETTLDTGASGMEELATSADGRYLGFVHSAGGGDPVVTVYDSRNGERVLHTALPDGVPVGAALEHLAAVSGFGFLERLG